MPGPAPKAPELRQRRNKSATRALLVPESSPIEKKPRLPNYPGKGNWHSMAKRWWSDVWGSPQRFEYMRADLGSLFRLVVLVDRYWKRGSMEVAREIRMLEREFGLTPLSRRRLEWTVAQAEEAKDRHEIHRSRRARIIENDPRGALDK